jgi:hypothetical protein
LEEIVVSNNHYEEVRTGQFQYMQRLGGEHNLKKIQTLMDMLEPQLLPCPLCGHAAILHGMFMYGSSPVVRVECPQCHCATPVLGERYDYLTGVHTSLEQCLHDSVKRWNKRNQSDALTDRHQFSTSATII